MSSREERLKAVQNPESPPIREILTKGDHQNPTTALIIPTKLKGVLTVGMVGWSTEEILRGKSGYAWFPVGDPDARFPGGRKWNKIEVRAEELVRPSIAIIVATEQHGVREHGPVEAKAVGFAYDDYKSLAFTANEVSEYTIGTAAKLADKKLPTEFIAEQVFLKPDAACLIRLEGEDRVQHELAVNTQYEFRRRTRKIYVVGTAGAGNLVIRAFGNVVGV